MACNLGTSTLLRRGTCSQAVAIRRYQIESSYSVFSPKLSENERQERGILFASSHVLEIRKSSVTTEF